MLHSPSQIFRDKPELVIGITNDNLPLAEIEPLTGKPGLAIVELAGRDSVAAALAAVEQHGLKTLLPTYVYTGSEYGPFSWVKKAHARLASRLPKDVELLETMILGSPGFWRALNGGLQGELNRRYGFPPVCVGCHLYLHAVRIPLARHLGAGRKRIPIISGERESHDNKLKLNQVAPALDAYAALCAEFGVELLLPIRQVDQGARIEEILGMAWPEGGEQVGCVLSGNYRGCGGEVTYAPDTLLAFLNEYALPLTRRVLVEYLAGGIPKHMDLALKLMRGIISSAKG